MLTCQEAGVLGSFSQAIGYLQAGEALKLLKGKNDLKLWKVNIQKEETRSMMPVRDPDCDACGKDLAGKESYDFSCAAK
jgi:molybdopterin/thiamine biosynthesis adenylyltransferase